MTIATLLVTAAGTGLIAALARYFFRPQVATVAGVGDDGQEMTVIVQGGYQPNLIHAHTGAPLRLVFDRREDGDCSSRVVIGDLGVNRFLAPFATTVVELPTDRPGTFEF
ncbi:MAG: cupredoxin domain-containing protein, partial [Acidimicrobiales bacterium]